MGNSVSNVNSNKYSSDDIARNIENLVRYNSVRDYSASDTMQFNPNSSSDFSLSLESIKGGSVTSPHVNPIITVQPTRNRFAQLEQQIRNMANQSNQRGGSVIDQYSSISEHELHVLKNLIMKSQNGNGQIGGCGCADDNNNIFSPTSTQPIDYNVLKGGAQPETTVSDESEEKKEKKEKKHKKEDSDDKDMDDDELDLEDEEDEDDEDEDMDEGTDDMGRFKPSSSTSSASSKRRSKSKAKQHRFSDYLETSQSDYVVNAKQFFSSESSNSYGSSDAGERVVRNRFR